MTGPLEESPAPASRAIAVRALLLVTVAALALYAGLGSIRALDLWWHMATGRYIVEEKSLPRVDVFSHTYEGAPWFNGESLSEVILFLTYREGGETALVAFKLAVVGAAFLLAGWIGWRRSASPVLAVAALVPAAYVCRPFFDIRPDLFLYLGTLGLLALLESYRRRPRRSLLFALPVWFAIWVNVHFSFTYGLGVLFVYAGTELVRARLGARDALPAHDAWGLAGAAAAAVVACLANPHGVRTLVFPFEILATDNVWRKDIVEWTAPVLFTEGFLNPALFGPYLLAQALLALLALVVAPRRFDVAAAINVAVTAAMALSARRFVPLFALVAAPFAASNLAQLRDWLAPWTKPRAPRWLGTAAIVTLCAAVVADLSARTVRDGRQRFANGVFAGMTDLASLPVGAAEFLDRNPLPGRLFHPYTWGGYLMFSTRRKVFIDGRGHTVYPDDFYWEDSAVEYGWPNWEAILDRREVGLIVWPSRSKGLGAAFELFISSGNWRPVYDDGQSTVLAHVERGRPWIDGLRDLTLSYPDNPRAQVFLADAHYAAQHFESARRLMQDALQRLPGQGVPSAPLDRLLETARATNEPEMWFRVGFYRDVRGERAEAVEAYRAALARGVPEPFASYAQAALARLAGP
jgi:hypothetical protein